MQDIIIYIIDSAPEAVQKLCLVVCNCLSLEFDRYAVRIRVSLHTRNVEVYSRVSVCVCIRARDSESDSVCALLTVLVSLSAAPNSLSLHSPSRPPALPPSLPRYLGRHH